MVLCWSLWQDEAYLLLDDDLFDADNVLDLDVPLLMTVASASIFSGTSIFSISTISKQLK